jgi:rubrerythrin
MSYVLVDLDDLADDTAFYVSQVSTPFVEKTGHWKIVEVLHGEWEGMKKYACDKCGEKVGIFKSNYCPNCGAKMESEVEL